MTDNEIIKALENAIIENNDCYAKKFQTEVLNLIERQKAEIKNIKSKAIKEFAESLKKLATVEHLSLDGKELVWVEDIDNLVKEMTIVFVRCKIWYRIYPKQMLLKLSVAKIVNGGKSKKIACKEDVFF